MLLASINIQKLKTFFHPSFFDRGYNYYHQNRVQDLKIKHDTENSEQVIARVRGSNSSLYEVNAYIHGSANKLYIRGICSCPIQINCKHVIATLIKALDQPANEKIGILDEQVQLPLIQDPKIDFWLRKLSLALKQENNTETIVDESYSLRYLLDKPNQHSNELQLSLVLVRRLKSGKLGTPKRFSETSYSQEKYLFPVDKELLVKIEMAKKLHKQSFYYNTIMKGHAFENLLSELIATGRCHWKIPGNPPLTMGKPEQVKLSWHIDENGFQEINPILSNPQGSFIIFSIDQLWYFNQSTAEFGLLETGLNKQVATILLSAPKIPPGSANYVTDVFNQDTRLSTVARPKVFKEVKVKNIKPTFCLRLSKATFTARGDYRNNYNFYQMTGPLVTLSFKYKDIEIPWGDERENITHISGEQYTQILRNKELENDTVEELIEEHDLLQVDTVYEFYNLPQNYKIAKCFVIKNDPLDFSQYSIPELRKNGWIIEISEDYPYQIVDEPIDDWYSAVDEGSSYDWFNLELGITLQGEKINLLPVLHELIKKLRSKSSTLDVSGTEPILAQLPDGRFIPLPIERVRNILNVLIELYDNESLSDANMLRLSKLHAARLLELEAAMGAAHLRWFGGEKLRELASKLVQFKGIKTVDIPNQFQGQLRPYQLEGLNWLQFLREYEFGGILADDMGLGKTVQALSHLTVEKVSDRMKNPSLIIAPTSLMFNWRMEAERFSPDLKILVLHGSDRKQQFENILQYDLVFTTYPLLKHDKEILLKNEFYFLILDEAQSIKNSKSLSTQIVQQIQAKHRLCLTGTPLENHLGELWSLFHFMMPGLLGEEKQFNRLFRTPIEKHGNQERREHLTRRIAPFLLRRTKNNVVEELPEKVNMIQHIEIDGVQRDLYETIRVTMQKKVKQEIAKLGLARSHIIILDALLKLRQVCCDPRLLKINTAQKNKAKSAKLELLMTLLPELIEEGRRILIFSQFTEMLELIESELATKQIEYVKLTGQTKDREASVRKFQNGEIPLFLISLKAGGTGLNLTTADTVIHYDPWWNPAVEDQATDRAHRIGQNKTVFVYKFVTKGTVEEKILEMQQNKRALMEGLFAGNTTGKLKLTEKDLQGFFEPLANVG